MLLCMRTTVDIPDSLMGRVKSCLIERKLTFRALVISALEQSLQEDSQPFRLRDASVGGNGEKVSNDTINQVIDSQRESTFQP